jgi:antitoxin component HigA of HigAB toxin-antitoxin module
MKLNLQDKYEKSGIHQIKCTGYPLKYAGQTGRAFHTRHKEHIEAIRNKNSNYKYSNHILNTGHAYRSVTNIMEREKWKTLEHIRKILSRMGG